MGFMDKAKAAIEEEQARQAETVALKRAKGQRPKAPTAESIEHGASLPKWEYKVLTETALAGWKKGTVDGLEPMLNHFAEQGWRVVSMSFTGQVEQFLARDKNHLYVVLERPAPSAADRADVSVRG